MPNQQQPRKALLIVDDDADFRALIRAFLSPAEFSVTEAPDGRAAVRHITATTYDVIVVDIVLPEYDGLELISKIRRTMDCEPAMASRGLIGRVAVHH